MVSGQAAALVIRMEHPSSEHNNNNNNNNKMESTLTQLVSRLGTCACASATTTPSASTATSGGLSDFFSFPNPNPNPSEEHRNPCSFPLLSLDHAHLMDLGGGQHKRNSKSTKAQVQSQASKLLLRQVTIDAQTETQFLNEIPGLLLDNLYASLDVLVDARMHVYSKILASHSLSLANAQCRKNADMAVEYKLKTLLQIGTSLSADAVETKFSVVPWKATTNNTTTNTTTGDLELTIPILMETFVRDLNIPSPTTTTTTNADDDGETSSTKLPLSFSAPGSIIGTFDSRSHQLVSIKVDVDCDALLSSMVEQATHVVSCVVELTNQAWSRALHLVVVEDEDEDEEQPSLPTTTTTQDLVGLATTTTPNQVVSPEFGPLFVIADDKEILQLDLDAHPQADVESYAESDNSINSFQKATNICDYVFGELDENMIVVPAPTTLARKKQRLS